MKIQVNVTENRIKRGGQCSASYCPVALAIKGSRKVSDAAVGTRSADVWVDGMLRIVALPEDVTARIRHFDDYREMKPFKFTLDIPE